MTTLRLLIACWSPKAAERHSEYLILIVLHYISGCTNKVQYYFFHTLSVLLRVWTYLALIRGALRKYLYVYVTLHPCILVHFPSATLSLKLFFITVIFFTVYVRVGVNILYLSPGTIQTGFCDIAIIMCRISSNISLLFVWWEWYILIFEIVS